MFGFTVFVFTLSSITAREFFYEKFLTNDSLSQWVQSTHHSEEKRGDWLVTSSVAWDDGNLGLKTGTDARFYAISRKLPVQFSNRGATLVIQYAVKYERTVSCGGAYLKLLRSDVDQEKFHGDTPYLFMFGPDICGYSTKKVHAIFNYNGQNYLIKKEVPCKEDEKSHLYTFILTPDNKYKILIDNEQAAEGTLEDDWDMLPPKQIDDPSAKKPEDWVDEEEIDDPDDTKPDDWDKPKTIPDPDAKKPDDWDDEMDGEWERPQIDNPDYKGEWTPKKIPNPKYKGPWEAPKIDNPDYKPNEELYVLEDIAHVGFDLWQVTSGSIFDDILLTDDPEFAKSEAESILRVRHKMETEYERVEEEKRAKEAKSSADKEKDEKEDEAEEDTHDEEEVKEEKDAEKEDIEAHEEL